MFLNFEQYTTALWVMAAIGVFVFVALFFVKAGYGIFTTKKWGFSLPNRIAWVIMEAPAFIIFSLMWILMQPKSFIPSAVFGAMFLLHYFQRSFVFPFLIKGNSRMPVAIMMMGFVFNTINAVLLFTGLFVYAPSAFILGWNYFLNPLVIAGIILFFAGMAVNMHSDHVIRNLRKPGDTKHYLPEEGMYHFVTSGNYFGEVLEWTGLAIASTSPAAWLFVWWTFANLAPRAKAINKKYRQEFGEDAVGNRKSIIPFIF